MAFAYSHNVPAFSPAPTVTASRYAENAAHAETTPAGDGDRSPFGSRKSQLRGLQLSRGKHEVMPLNILGCFSGAAA